MHGGDNVDAALGRELKNIQLDKAARKKRVERLTSEFERRIQKKEREEAQFYDLDLRVTEQQVRDPFGKDARGDENFAFYGAEFDSDASAKGYDPTWVAIASAEFDEMMLSKKDAKERNSIGGKNVRAILVDSEGRARGRVFLVRAQELEAFRHKEDNEDEAVVLMRDLVNDLRRKINIVWGDVSEKNAAANAYLQAHPEQAERLKLMIEMRNATLGPKSMYKPKPGDGCDMNVDGKPRLAQFWKDQNHGTPEKPNPVNDFPERREKKDKKWHKALMVLDKDLKATCVSPETMAASGKSYAEDIAPKVYHHVTDVVKLSHKKPIKDLNGEELSEEKIWGDMIACAQYGGDDEDRCGSTESKGYPLSKDKAIPANLCRFEEDTGNDATPAACVPKWLKKDSPDEWKDLYYGSDGLWLQEVAFVEEEMRRKLAGQSGLSAKQRIRARKMGKSGRVQDEGSARTRYVPVTARRRKQRKN